MRIELKAGLLIYAAAMTLQQFFTLPHFLFGLLLGLSISLETVGIVRGNRSKKEAS